MIIDTVSGHRLHVRVQRIIKSHSVPNIFVLIRPPFAKTLKQGINISTGGYFPIPILVPQMRLDADVFGLVNKNSTQGPFHTHPKPSMEVTIYWCVIKGLLHSIKVCLQVLGSTTA